MGWVRTLWRIFLDKARAEWLDFLFEIVWTALNILVTVLLWGSILPKVSVWGVETIIAFAIFMEIYYLFSSPLRDMAWAYVDMLVDGEIEPLTKPMKDLYIFVSRTNAGELIAGLMKLVTFSAILLVFPKWWLGWIVFIFGFLVYVGFEMVTVSLSYLLIESGRLWDFLYTVQGRLVHMPSVLYNGAHRLLVTLLFPVYFYITLPAELTTGLWDKTIVYLPAALALWLGGGYMLYRRTMENLQAYGG